MLLGITRRFKNSPDEIGRRQTGYQPIIRVRLHPVTRSWLGYSSTTFTTRPGTTTTRRTARSAVASRTFGAASAAALIVA